MKIHNQQRINSHQLGRGWRCENVEVYESGWTLICSKYGRIIKAFYKGQQL